MKKALLALLAFFLTCSSSQVHASVGSLDLSGDRNTFKQFIIDSNLENSTSAGIGNSQGINNCGLNALQSITFDVPEFDTSKSYLLELTWLISADSSSNQNTTQPVWFSRANTPDPSTPLAFTTTTVQVSNENFVVGNNNNTSFNTKMYLTVTPSNNGSTIKRMQIGNYVSANNYTYLIQYPQFQNCSTPNSSYFIYRVISIQYIEIDDSVITSVPLLLNQIIDTLSNQSGNSGGSSGGSVNLQTIEDYLDSIDTNTAYTNTLLNTLLTDLTNINTSIQSGNSNTTSLINDLSSIISALSTLANNQGTITQNQVTQDTNIATYISGQTSTIQSLLNQIIANQGSTTVNVDMTTTNNLLSDIQSSLYQIESYASSNATNIYGIAQNANTQTQYQYDIAQNTDYIPLIYNFLSGGTSTPDYSFTLNTIDQNSQISAANSTFFKQQYESNDTSVTNSFSSFANSVINQGYQTGVSNGNEQALKSGIPNLLQRPWTLQSVDCEKLDPSLTSYSVQTRYTCYHDGTFNKCLQVDFCVRRHLANIFNGGTSDDAYTDTSQAYSCDFFLTGLTGGPSMNCGTNFLAMIDTIARTMIYFYIITDIYKTIINIANVTHDDKLDILEI